MGCGLEVAFVEVSVEEKKIYNVIIKGEEHQANENEQTNLLCDLTLTEAERFAVDDFNGKEKQVPTI